VLQLVRPDGQNLATLVNYAVHPRCWVLGAEFARRIWSVPYMSVWQSRWWHGDFYEFGGGRHGDADNRLPEARGEAIRGRNVSESAGNWRMRPCA